MFANHFRDQFLAALNFVPTGEQMQLTGIITTFYFSDNVNSAFLLKGYAGTGKTSIISAFIKTLNVFEQPFVLLAPTGRAAKVLSHMSGFPAYTIHKQIFRQQMVGAEPESLGNNSFSLDFNKYKDTVFIVDEASMISNRSDELNLFGSGNLLDELMRYVYQGARCRVVFIGDLAQLPPVGTVLSPALDPGVLSSFGVEVHEFTLREVLRQATESAILLNATLIRTRLAERKYGEIPRFRVNQADVIAVNGELLSEQIGNSFNEVGMENVMLVTRSNKRANLFNQGIRSSVLYREEELVAGDYLMVVKNNYFWTEKVKELDFIANGDLVKVERISSVSDVHGKRFADVTISFPDYGNVELDVKLLLSTLLHDGPSMTLNEMQELYFAVLEDYPQANLKPEQRKTMRKDPFYNAIQVKYGYAVTCHKAQGGQWKHLYLDLGYVTDEMVDMEFLRWLYTAVTRATDKLFLINFPENLLKFDTD